MSDHGTERYELLRMFCDETNHRDVSSVRIVGYGTKARIIPEVDWGSGHGTDTPATSVDLPDYSARGTDRFFVGRRWQMGRKNGDPEVEQLVLRNFHLADGNLGQTSSGLYLCPPARALRVLVLDVELKTLDLIGEMLQVAGFAAITCTSAVEAHRLVDTGYFDVFIVIDRASQARAGVRLCSLESATKYALCLNWAAIKVKELCATFIGRLQSPKVQQVTTMIEKCVNPLCDEPFTYFRTGRIYSLGYSHGDRRSRATERLGDLNTEYFWLCGSCCDQNTAAISVGNGMVRIVFQPRLTLSSEDPRNRDTGEWKVA